jgi:hypothetical protein
MICDAMVECSASKNPTNKSTMTTTTIDNTCMFPMSPMTPATQEVVVLTTGSWHPGWKANTWTAIPSFEEQWALAKTAEERASLLAFYSPTASPTLTHYQRSILMSVKLPATKSSHPDAELTFCDGTLRKRVCGFAYCVEDTPDGEGYWYCDECRGYREEDEDFDFIVTCDDQTKMPFCCD